jgi:hypothetical protein
LDFAPKRAPKTRARRPPPHRSKNDVSCLRSSLSWSSVGHGQAIRVAAVRSKSSSPPSDGIPNGFCEPATLIDCWPPRPCDRGPSCGSIERPDCKRESSCRLS